MSVAAFVQNALCANYDRYLASYEVVEEFQQYLSGKPMFGQDDSVHFICLKGRAAAQPGSKVAEKLDTEDKWRSAEALLSDPEARISAFFLGLMPGEQVFTTELTRNPKQMPSHVYPKPSKNQTERLLTAVKPHVSLLQSFMPSQGNIGLFLSDSGNELHLTIRTCDNGDIMAVHYLRFDLVADKLVLVVASNHNDALYDNFTTQFESATDMKSTFAVVLNILKTHQRTIQSYRLKQWKHLTEVETATGSGKLWKIPDLQNSAAKSYSTSDAGKVCSTVNRLQSCIIATEFQLRVVDRLVAASKVYWKRRRELQRQVVDSPPMLAYRCSLEDTLLYHKSSLQAMAANMRYAHARARDQVAVIEAGINHSRAEKAGTVTNFIVVLTVVGIIFLPCALIAQLAASPYFEAPKHRWTGIENPTVGTLAWVSAISVLTTATSCVFLYLAVRAWFKRGGSGRIPTSAQDMA